MKEFQSYTDRDLIVLLRKDSSFAFEILFDRYSQKIYRFSYSYLKNKEETEEIVQEVFMKVWKIRKELLQDKAFDSLLFIMARNAVLNAIRKEKSKQVWQNYVGLYPKNNILPDEELDFKELERLYKRAVGQLSPKRKEIYIMSREQALSNAEIATIMGISVKTVENQMTSALSALKRNFRAKGFS